MQIYVCVKHVPDSAANVHIVDNLKIDESVPFLLNPYDEHAVTEAGALKNQVPDSEIIAVCLGKKTRKAPCVRPGHGRGQGPAGGDRCGL